MDIEKPTRELGATAKALARNPLGIIALFIVLVYGLASLVTGFATSFTPGERLPLIYFLITFPVLVLVVFAWLVSRHSVKLFAPSDFKDEENFIKMQTTVAPAPTDLTTKSKSDSDAELDQLVETARARWLTMFGSVDSWRNQILWVCDNPENHTYERQAFEAIGLRFTMTLNTDAAFEKLYSTRYAAIISHIGSRECLREGYVLLDRLRNEGYDTPLFFYTASNAPEHNREMLEHGGQGCTNSPRELVEIVTNTLIQSKPL
jgi:CheY-like chemotaxis protein